METNEKKDNIEVEIEDQDLEEFDEPEEIKGDNDEDVTDWQAIAKENYGRAKRYQTKLKKIKEVRGTEVKAEEPEKAKQPQDKKEFDYAEKAFLKANDLQKDEYPLVLEAMNSTGKTLDEVLESKYFQSELKEKREEKDSEEAVPRDTKRAGGAAKNSVDYWIAKGELPPDTPENQQLRRDVVNAKVKAEETSHFTKNPVVE